MPEPIGPGQQSVWDYPRPPRVEPSSRRVRVIVNGVTVASSTRALRLLERSHPPTWYLPPTDVRLSLLRAARAPCSTCEWKGEALYHDVVVSGRCYAEAAWSYPEPRAPYEAIRDHFAFYVTRVDACYVDDELVLAQPGGFYGGWITRDVVGPFKGGPGTWGW